MPSNPQTAIGVGIRRNFTTLGYRNFEPDQTTPVQYKSNHTNLEFLGTIYQPGSNLTFDVGGVSYSAKAVGLLQLYWNQGFITPAT